MTQPVTINHDARSITFQIGKLIPPPDARANLHRLLDLALDALAMNTDIPEGAVHGDEAAEALSHPTGRVASS